jgi:streptomycin 6-kinase
MSPHYPDTFAQTITSIYGDQGAQWLAQLPQLIEQCVQQWQLTDLQPVANLTCNYVLFGMQNGMPVGLKLRCVADELGKEVTALTAFAGHGSVKLLAHNDQLGALLLERALPGDTLTSYFPQDDAKATQIAANLVRTLHQVNPVGGFPLLHNVLPDLSKEPQALMPFLARARDLKAHLLVTQQKQVLLHGDFHHGNILAAGNGTWVVIDPEGIIGDPVYDLAVYIRNPLKELVIAPNAKIIIPTRISDFAQQLGYSPQRIYDWVYVQAVCSVYWSLEDGLDASKHVTFLHMLQDIQI